MSRLKNPRVLNTLKVCQFNIKRGTQFSRPRRKKKGKEKTDANKMCLLIILSATVWEEYREIL